MSDCSGMTNKIEEEIPSCEEVVKMLKNVKLDEMTSENYVKLATRSDCVYDMALHARLVSCSRLLHAAIGLATESGELLDMLKKHIYYGRKLDVVNAKEECGDLYWYLALALDDMHTTMNDVMKLNIDKLKLRYPKKFSGEAAINRDVKAERVLLERVDIKDEVKALQENVDITTLDDEKKKILTTTHIVTISDRGFDFGAFALKVAHHIENYTVPQYGDKGKDQATDFSIEVMVEHVKRYLNRIKTNQRPGEEMRDLYKAAHYVQMIATKLMEQ